jgi:16S rRNA (uracil1498-N3)-methyltransferase
MHLFRFYLSPELCKEYPVKITGADAHHALNVLRLKIGDSLLFFDGEETEYSSEICSVKRGELILGNIKEARREKPKKPRIVLYAALTSRFDDIVETATEIGASGITPVITKLTQTRIPRDSENNKLERWRRVAVSASMQSGRIALPEICGVTRFDEALAASGPGRLRLIASLENESLPILSVLRSMEKAIESVDVFIGPPADFTADELAGAAKAGLLPVRLASNTLRSETAAFSALAVISSFLYTHSQDS